MSLRRHLTSAKSWIPSQPQNTRSATTQWNSSRGSGHRGSLWATWLKIMANPVAVSTKSATLTSLTRWCRRQLGRQPGDQSRTAVDQWIRSSIPQHSTSTLGHLKGRFINSNQQNPSRFTCHHCRIQPGRNRVLAQHSSRSNTHFSDTHGLSRSVSRLAPFRPFSSAAAKDASNAASTAIAPTSPFAVQAKKQPSRVEKIRRILEQQIRTLDSDGLYRQFWRICQEESIDNQKQIWSRKRLKQSSIYRIFNNPAKPTMTRAGQPIINVMYTSENVHPEKSTTPSVNNDSTPRDQYSLHFVASSHPARLLQMHQYFEQVLDIPAGSEARLALIVAMCSYGDMITAERLFQGFRSRAGEEMYGAMIRGWISKTNRRLEKQGLPTEDQLRVNKQRASRINSAMELFYEMQQRGIVPSFETYHTLTVGLATFKNDPEAAELMLQHMILRKGKPYVQVLHILLREYERRGDFSGMMRIRGLYDEYGLQLKPISANIMLKAVFQLRGEQIQAMVNHPAERQEGEEATDHDEGQRDNQVLQFKRRQIAEIRASLSRQDGPDDTMFSTLIYGYGHLPGAQEDLEQVIQELRTSKVPMTTVLWTSMVMAFVGQRQLGRAEAALDESLTWFKQKVLKSLEQEPRVPMGGRANKTGHRASVAKSHAIRGWKPEAAMTRRLVLPIPRGVFHAVMVGMVELRDMAGMERTVGKMMDLHAFCEAHEEAVGRLAAYSDSIAVWRGPRQHEADEYTANILLLGYLMAKDVDKARRVARQIAQHPSWETRRGHAGIEALKQYVFQQAAKTEARTMQKAGGEEEEEDGTKTYTTRGLEAKEKQEEVTSNGDVDELDDDVEIDVQALTRRLRSTVEQEKRGF